MQCRLNYIYIYTSFCLDAVDTMSNVSGSGDTSYFFMIIEFEKSLRGINANQYSSYINLWYGSDKDNSITLINEIRIIVILLAS